MPVTVVELVEAQLNLEYSNSQLEQQETQAAVHGGPGRIEIPTETSGITSHFQTKKLDTLHSRCPQFSEDEIRVQNRQSGPLANVHIISVKLFALLTYVCAQLPLCVTAHACVCVCVCRRQHAFSVYCS